MIAKLILITKGIFLRYIMACLLLVSSLIGLSFSYAQENQQYVLVNWWGSYGTGDGQFISPNAITLDSKDNVFVADVLNSRIQKFNNNGTFLMKWGSYGTGDGQFTGSSGAAIDSKDNVFVVDIDSARIQKFNNNGTFLMKWGSYCDIRTGYLCGNKNTTNIGNGEFNAPTWAAADMEDKIYIADTSNSRVQKFNNNGTFLMKWGYANHTNDNNNNTAVQLSDPQGIAVDSSNKVFISDIVNQQVLVFAPMSNNFK
jgi:streptogramin lyase